MLFQSAALLDSMTIYDNVAFPLREKTSLNESDIEKRATIAWRKSAWPEWATSFLLN